MDDKLEAAPSEIFDARFPHRKVGSLAWPNTQEFWIRLRSVFPPQESPPGMSAACNEDPIRTERG